MRARNPSYDRAAARTRGHVGGRAGTPGQTHLDTSGNSVTAPDTQYIGATVSGEDGDTAYVTITGTGHQPTNDSGIDLVYGEVVVLATDGTVTTTTTAQDTRPVGIVQIGAADGDPVGVVFSGYVAQVNTTGTVAAGDYLETSATAGTAQSSGVARRIGSFAQALADGPNPPALLYGAPDPAGTGTGGAVAPVEHGNMGATETIDLVVGTVHRGTLNANCAITVTGFTAGMFAEPLFFEVAQNGIGGFGITWDGDVASYGDDQPDLAATSVTQYVLFGMDGDGLIYAFKVGGGGSVETLATTETDTALVLAPDGTGGVGWVSAPSGSGRWELAVIPGSPPDSLYAGGDWLYIFVP